MTISTDCLAIKRLGHEDAPETAEPPTFESLIEARVVAVLNERLDAITDELVTKLLTDHTAFVKLWPKVLTIEDCARIYQMHPDTMRRFTQLPGDHPDHLPRVDERPTRILPGHFAAWLLRRRER